jgi:hypothetical protein
MTFLEQKISHTLSVGDYLLELNLADGEHFKNSN